jgi:hypothetical protein
MDDLEIKVSYNGRDFVFPLKLAKYGYTYRIEVMVENVPVIFEPDEEGNFRVIVEESDLPIEKTLLAAIAEKLQSIRE